MNVPKRRLLLADDSITIQKVVNLTFAEEGIEVTTVSDGDAALDHLARETPDLVMADVNMPGANGYQICEAIRAHEATRSVPVVLLVGSFEPFDEAEAERVGANAFMTKPFQSIRQLVATITEMMDESASPVISESFEQELPTAELEPEETFSPVLEHEQEHVQEQVYEEEPARVESLDDIDHLYTQSVFSDSAAAEAPSDHTFTGNELDDEMIETSYTTPETVDFALPDSGDVSSDESVFEEETAEPDTTPYYPEISTTAETVKLPSLDTPFYQEQPVEEKSFDESSFANVEEPLESVDPAPVFEQPVADQTAYQFDELPETENILETTSNVVPIGTEFKNAEYTDQTEDTTTEVEETVSYVEPLPVEKDPFESKAEAQPAYDTNVASTAVDMPPASFFEEINLLDLPPAGENMSVEFTTPVLADDAGSNKQVVSVSAELMEIIVQKVLERLQQK